MVLYPPTSNMRTIIDDFFRESGVQPRVVMEAADTEVIKSLVQAGFGYSVLPAYALTNSGGFFQTLRVAGHRLARKQALVTSHTGHARPLTEAVTAFLKEEVDRPIRKISVKPGRYRAKPARVK
jgi:DNA-binding transcriptional LysR family regulator